MSTQEALTVTAIFAALALAVWIPALIDRRSGKRTTETQALFERAELVSYLLEELFEKETVNCREMLRQALMQQPLAALTKIRADVLAVKGRARSAQKLRERLELDR